MCIRGGESSARNDGLIIALGAAVAIDPPALNFSSRETVRESIFEAVATAAAVSINRYGYLNRGRRARGVS